MTAKVTNVQDASVWGPIYTVTAQKGQIVLDAAKKAGHEVVRVYGYNTTPDHNNKQCIDFMHYGNTQLRLWLEDYLKKNKTVLGVEGIISMRRVMGFPSQGTMYRGPEGGWRTYYGPNPHTDHVHVQFNTNKVKGKTSAPAKSSSSNKAKTTPGAWHGTLYVIKDVVGYDGTGRKRTDQKLKSGGKITGYVDTNPFGDGRYLRTGKVPHRIWFPLDSGNFSHSKGGPAIVAPTTNSTPDEWHGKLWLLKKTTAYNKAGKAVRTYPAGKGFTGYVDTTQFPDGRYFRVWKIPHRLWLPLDDNNFSHSKGGKPVKKG